MAHRHTTRLKIQAHPLSTIVSTTLSTHPVFPLSPWPLPPVNPVSLTTTDSAPATTTNNNSASLSRPGEGRGTGSETGIIAAGHAYILADLSLHGDPNEWARRTIGAYETWQAVWALYQLLLVEKPPTRLTISAHAFYRFGLSP